MLTRRTLLALLGATPLLGCASALSMSTATSTALRADGPALAPGAPMSPERRALVDAFVKRSAGLEERLEARTHRGDWTMPYRLFRPATAAKTPLVVYLHGSGGSGDDNRKQLALGNVFGTRVWLLPENQQAFPCHVVAPQTDRGWIRYDFSSTNGPARPIAGFGDGARVVVDLIDELRRELPIDADRIYVTGQSMGGAGVWNLLAHRGDVFAAAIACCGSESLDDGGASPSIPLWNFHGDADATVPIDVSRRRLAARRAAGGQPLATEYAGVGHNSWEWAYTESALPRWLFAQRRSRA